MLGALEQGFISLTRGEVKAPPRNGVEVEHGFLLSMPGWLPGKSIGIKLVAGFHDNPKHGLPGHQALICLFDSENGSPLAVMDGTAITALRTAGGSAVSVKHLARKDSHTLAIIGAGVQGQSHLQVIPSVRDITEIRIASFFPEDAVKLAAQHPHATAFDSFEKAARGADIVCLCTSSDKPVITAAAISPGTHVTSVGYAPPGGELDRSIVDVGRLFVETKMAFAPAPAGCSDLAGVDESRGAELGEVLLGKKPGRISEQEITVYKAMGHAMEDLVTAQLVFDRASAAGAGQTFRMRAD